MEPKDQIWSRSTTSRQENWTINGLGLDSVRFFTNIKDGTPFIKLGGDEPPPLYRAGMRPTEIAETFVDTLTREGAGRVSYSDLAPVKFGDQQGFEFKIRYFNCDGLEYQGIARGAIDYKDRLQLMLFQAPAVCYYESASPAAIALFDSVRMIGR